MKPAPETCLDLFRRGMDTLDIARYLKRWVVYTNLTEADVYNILSSRFARKAA